VSATCRVGCDLMGVADVRASMARFGGRYLRRVYTDHEVASSGAGAPGLAARFAAKEATVKILRAEDEPLPWPSIEVRRSAVGWCELVLSGRAAELADEQGLRDFDVSLSHEADYAMAVVHAQVEVVSR